MSEGFRKSLFGFNCDDVVQYIKKTHKEFSDKETVLQEKNNELKVQLSGIKRQIDDLTAQNSKLEAQLSQYVEREEEIKRVAENIGKLYIVSQSNAKAIIETAEENRRIISNEVEQYLKAIAETNDSLATIVKGVNDTSNNFTDKVKGLSNDLENTKDILEKNDNTIRETSKNLSAVKESLE